MIKCYKCDKPVHSFNAYYSKKTLYPHCEICAGNFMGYMNYDEYRDYLAEDLFEIGNREGKAISTRLDIPQMFYLLKFAQVHNTENISQTISKVIDELRKDIPLDDVVYDGRGFKRSQSKKDRKIVPTGLKIKEIKEKQTFVVEKPKEVTVIEDEEDGDNEDVFTI